MEPVALATSPRPRIVTRLRARGGCAVCGTSAIALAALVAVIVVPTVLTLVVLGLAVVAQLVVCSRIKEDFVLVPEADGEVVQHRIWSRTNSARLNELGRVTAVDPDIERGLVLADRTGAAIVIPAWRLAQGDALAQRLRQLPAA